MAVITNPISNIPQNQKSHVLGWSQTWEEQLNAAINHKCTPAIMQHDVVYIDHGANFGGTLNLFGGATKEIYDKINFVAACNEVISLDHDMPQWGEQLRKRIGNATTYEGITEEWCDALTKRLKNVSCLKQEHLGHFENITLGDSHTIAFSALGDRCYRNDGKTLFGALKAGLKSMLRDTVPRGTLTLSFGSIDLRHHIVRQKTDIPGLIQEYVKQGQELEKEFGCDVWFATPVPVEWEGRKIPKSGFYKKTPFFGSMEERRAATEQFIVELYKQSGKVVQAPEEWYTMDGEQYAKTYMEFGSSFHIAPPFYRRNDWGQSPLGI